MRIGVNGVIGLPGQSFATLERDARRLELHRRGGPAALERRRGDRLRQGSGHRPVLPVVRPVRLGHACLHRADPDRARPPTDNPPSPDLGMRNLRGDQRDDVDDHRSAGRPTDGHHAVQLVQQSLPPAPQIDAFLASQQTAISQLARAYCERAGGQPAATAMRSSAPAGRDLSAHCGRRSSGPAAQARTARIVINALTSHAVGTGVNAPDATAVVRPSSMRCSTKIAERSRRRHRFTARPPRVHAPSSAAPPCRCSDGNQEITPCHPQETSPAPRARRAALHEDHPRPVTRRDFLGRRPHRARRRWCWPRPGSARC